MESSHQSHEHRRHRRHRAPSPKKGLLNRVINHLQDTQDYWNKWHEDGREGRRNRWGRRTELYDQHWEAMKKKDADERLKRREDRKLRRENRLKDEGVDPQNDESTSDTKDLQDNLASGGRPDEILKEKRLSLRKLQRLKGNAVAKMPPIEEIIDQSSKGSTSTTSSTPKAPDEEPEKGCEEASQCQSRDDVKSTNSQATHDQAQEDPTPTPKAKVESLDSKSGSEDDDSDSSSDVSSTKATVTPNSSVSGKPSSRGGFAKFYRDGESHDHEDFDDEYEEFTGQDGDEVESVFEDNPERESEIANGRGARYSGDMLGDRVATSFGQTPYIYRRAWYPERPPVLRIRPVTGTPVVRVRPFTGTPPVVRVRPVAGTPSVSTPAVPEAGARAPRLYTRVGNLANSPRETASAADENRRRSPRPYVRVGRTQADPSDEEGGQQSRSRQSSEKPRNRRRRRRQQESESSDDSTDDDESEYESDSPRLSSNIRTSDEKPVNRLYTLLSVSTQASHSEIVRAGRAARIRVHPDKMGTDRSETAKADNQRLAAEVGEAVETLTDPSKRKEYDDGERRRRLRRQG